MRASRLAIAFVAALAGLVWMGQGLGFIGGSFMSGDPVWAVIGGGLLVAAAAVVARELRRT